MTREREVESPFRLTPAEDKILKMFAQGKTTKEIAGEMGLSLHTVRFRLGQIREKLGVKKTTEIVIRALMKGWLKGEEVPAAKGASV